MRHIRKPLFAFWVWLLFAILLGCVQYPLLAEIFGIAGVGAKSFFVTAFVNHCLILSLPASLLLLAFSFVPRGWGRKILLGVVALCFLATALFVYIDMEVYKIYSFHIDGMVLNLLLNPAAGDSVDLTRGIYLGIAIRILWFLLIMAVFSGVVFFLRRRISRRENISRMTLWLPAFFFVLCILSISGEKLLLAYANFVGNTQMTVVNSVMGPLFANASNEKLMIKLGFVRDNSPQFGGGVKFTKYPLNELKFNPDAKHYNIVFVVIESTNFRVPAEMIPNIDRLAQENISTDCHYSGGNTTRFGFASLFYGIFSTNWHNLLAEKKSPLLFKVLRELDYRILAASSTDLNFPEFRATVFHDLKEEEIVDHWEVNGGIERDRLMTDLVIEYIKSADGKPFFVSAFYDSPHLPYLFPPEFEIAVPVMPVEEVDIVGKKSADFVAKLRNRSYNSLAYIDSLVGEIINTLKEQNLYDDTIIVIVGDHGQEFYGAGDGAGHLGHNANFSRDQAGTIFGARFPGYEARKISRITSHYDVAPTVLEAIGVENPASDYSNGTSLLADSTREYVVVASWSDAAIVSSEYIVNYGYDGANLGKFKILSAADSLPVEQTSEVNNKINSYLLDYLSQRSRFSK